MPSFDNTYNFRVAGQAYDAITSLTDNTGGAASDTLASVSGANPTAAEHENAVASLAAKIEEILDVLRRIGAIPE